jgi:hypothetical protein
MPEDRAALLDEAHRRGILPQDMAAAWTEARSRGLVTSALDTGHGPTAPAPSWGEAYGSEMALDRQIFDQAGDGAAGARAMMRGGWDEGIDLFGGWAGATRGGANNIKWSKAQIETLRRMYQEGVPVPDVAKQLGFTADSVMNKARRSDIRHSKAVGGVPKGWTKPEAQEVAAPAEPRGVTLPRLGFMDRPEVGAELDAPKK